MSKTKVHPDTVFELQCLNCDARIQACYKDAILTCPRCGSVELHVVAMLEAVKVA